MWVRSLPVAESTDAADSGWLMYVRGCIASSPMPGRTGARWRRRHPAGCAAVSDLPTTPRPASVLPGGRYWRGSRMSSFSDFGVNGDHFGH